jgi:hypothetical protein
VCIETVEEGLGNSKVGVGLSKAKLGMEARNMMYVRISHVMTLNGKVKLRRANIDCGSARSRDIQPSHPDWLHHLVSVR